MMDWYIPITVTTLASKEGDWYGRLREQGAMLVVVLKGRVGTVLYQLHGRDGGGWTGGCA